MNTNQWHGEDGMNRITQGTRRQRPWHLWLVGVLAILWNGMGALDYTMTQTRNEAYLRSASPEMLDFVYGLPDWIDGFWAIGVWGGLLGSILLLLGRRLATPVLGASFVGALVVAVHIFGFAGGMAAMGGAGALAFSATIVIVALGLVPYSCAMNKRLLAA